MHRVIFIPIKVMGPIVVIVAVAVVAAVVYWSCWGGDIRSPRSGQIIDKGNKQCKYHSLEISLVIYLQGTSNHRKGKRRSMILDCSFIHNYSHLTSNLPVRAWNRSPSVPVGAGRSWSEPGCNVAT